MVTGRLTRIATTTDLYGGLNSGVRIAWETPDAVTCNDNGQCSATLSAAAV